MSFMRNPSLGEGFEGGVGDFQEDRRIPKEDSPNELTTKPNLTGEYYRFAIHRSTTEKYRASPNFTHRN